MAILEDIFPSGLRVVFCGTAVGDESARSGHYYAHPKNDFWKLIYEAGFTERQLRPDEDFLLPSWGLGLTDLNKSVAQNHDRGLEYDVAGLVAKLEMQRPHWIAFTSKEAAKASAKSSGAARHVSLGYQSWHLGSSKVFVLPSPSGANRRANYDGRTIRVEWWAELASLALFRD